jgi:hypothetical protein
MRVDRKQVIEAKAAKETKNHSHPEFLIKEAHEIHGNRLTEGTHCGVTKVRRTRGNDTLDRKRDSELFLHVYTLQEHFAIKKAAVCSCIRAD